MKRYLKHYKLSKILYIIQFFIFVSCNTQETFDNRIYDSEFSFPEHAVFEHTKGHVIRLFSDTSNIYLTSAPEFKVYVYDLNGNFIKTLGKSGRAPWENGSIWYFIRDKNTYWIHDYTKQLIKQYDYNSDTLLKYRRINTINNIIHLYGKKFLIPRIKDADNSLYLSVFEADSGYFEKDINISSLLKINRSNNVNFLLHGNFCKNLNNEIIYAFSNVGFFIKTDSLCETIKIFEDVRKLPIPVTYIKNQKIRLEPKQVAALSVTVDDKVIYVLTIKDASKPIIKTQTFFIDMYNLSNGNYLKSIRLNRYKGEDFPFLISKTKDSLIVVYNSYTIIIYDLKCPI